MMRTIFLATALAGLLLLWLGLPADQNNGSAQEKKPVNPSDIFKDPKKPDPMKKKNGEESSLTTPVGGKTIDQWIAEIPSPDPSKSENAIRTLLIFNQQLVQQRGAVGALVKVLSKHSSSTPIDLSVRVNAVIVLGDILSEENEPEPALIKQALPWLIWMLQDSQALVKYRAAQALSKIGPDAAAAITTLTTTINDGETWEVRQAAAYALGSIAGDKKNGPPAKVLNALYGRLIVDKAFQVRLAAIQALTKLGAPADPKAQKAVFDALSNVANTDPESTVKIWAHMAIMNIEGKADNERLKLIGKFLQDKDLYVRIQATQALWASGLDGKSEAPQLAAALEDPEKAVVMGALLALSRMGRFADVAQPQLQKIIKNEEIPQPMRQLAQEVLDTAQGKVSKKDEKDKKSKVGP